MFIFRSLPRVIGVALVLWLAAYSSEAHAANVWACAPEETNCRSVFVVHDSWHAAIVLRKEDISGTAIPELVDYPDARLIEFSWGDKDYFPDPKFGVLKALQAAFWSRGSVMHLVGFAQDLEKFYPGASFVELRLASRAYDRLIDFISRSFLRSTANGRAQASPGLYRYSRFYPATGKFSIVNTCNTWVAGALEAGGLPVFPGLVISAAQLGEQLDKIQDKR
jgi:uncharacterized protein (TIGR02117 family)